MYTVTRYTVTVKENKDSFSSFNLKQVKKWANEYEYYCLNQDEPWEPHFEFVFEKLKERRNANENQNHKNNRRS